MAADENTTLRDYFAAERTLLAWIRTTIAMMTFGFVVARFGIFLREIATLQRPSLIRSGGMSLWFGIALVGFAVLINVVAVRQYTREIRQLNRSADAERKVSGLAWWTGIGLALLGVLMGSYLIAISGDGFTGIMAE